MNKRTFEQAFNAIFHDKNAYEEFLNLCLESEIEEVFFKNKRLYRTSEKLKKYLRFIDRVILRNLAKNEVVVHSFTKGKSTLTALKEHEKSKVFFQTDIKNFYPEITSSDVRRIFLRDLELIPIVDFNDYVDRVSDIVTVKEFLPIGFATSPQISNAFLYEFDNVLKNYCDENKLIYTRYADDLIISSCHNKDLSNIKYVVNKILFEFASESMVLNESKTHISTFKGKVKALGLVILPNGQVTIDSKYKKKIEYLLYFYNKDKEVYSKLLDDVFKDGEHSFFGLLHYAKSVDPKYIHKLQRKYGVFSVRSLMEEKWNDA